MGELADLLRNKKKARASAPSSGGKSVGGFLENVLGDVGEIASGLGTLGISLVKDVGGEVAEAASFGAYNHSSTLDELLKAAPRAIIDDYKRRYGSGWESFVQGMYEDPLALVGDIATVATLGGAGAARGAQLASKVGNVSDDLARIAARSADDVGRTAKVVDAVLPGAKDKALLESMGHKSTLPLGGTRQVFNPTNRALAEVPRAFNPTRRMVREKVVDRALTKPAAALRKDLNDRLKTPLTSTVEEIDLKLLNDTVALAEKNNIRAWREPVSKLKTYKLVGRITGESKTAHVGKRDEAMAQWEEVFRGLPDEEMDNFHIRMQMDTPKAPAARLDFDRVERALADPSLIETPQGQRIAQAVGQHVSRVREMEQLGTHVPKIRERVTNEFLDELARNGRFKDLPPFTRRADVLEPDEVKALEDRISQRAGDEVEAGRRLVEAVAGEPLAAFGDDTLDAATQTMDAARLLNFEQQASRFLDDGGDYLTLFKRQYLPLRVSQKHANKLKSLDETADPFDLDDQIQALGKKTPVYFPHYEALTKKSSDFLMSTNISGARRQAQVSRYKKSKGENFENYLKGVKDAYDTNPADAYSRLAAEIVKHDQMGDWVKDVVTKVGRPVSAMDEVGSGEVVINLDSVRRVVRNRKTAMESIHEAMEEGAPADKAFVKAISDLFSEPGKHVDEALSEGQSLFAIPKVAAKRLQMEGGTYLNNAAVRLAWDTPMQAWRSAVLYAAPRYYVNNAFGNTAFLKLQGGKLSGVLRQLDKGYRERLRQTIGTDALPDVESGFYSKPLQRNTNMGAAESTTVGQLYKGVKESKVGRGAGRAKEGAQEFNSFIENVYRRESQISAMEKQARIRGVKLAGNPWLRSRKRLEQIQEVGADPKIARAAMEDMNKAMNNYNALGPLERNVIRRFVAPFWPFYKHAARTLFTMPFEHPAKARLLDWVHEVDKDLDQLGERPEWLEDFTPLGAGDQPGEVRFLSSRGANPLSGVMESPMSLLGPAPQLGIEQVTGRDTFTGKQFSAPGVYNDPFSGQQFGLDDAGQPMTLERQLGGLRAPVAPSVKESLLGLFPQVDLYRDIRSGAGRYSAADEVITDETGQPMFRTDPLQELLKFAGVSTMDYDLANWQAKQAEAKQRALNSLSERP